MDRTARMYSRAKAVFAKLERKLLRKHTGQFVAVEPISRDFVVGTDEVNVALKARRRHPGKLFGFFRVGSPAVHKMRRVGSC